MKVICINNNGLNGKFTIRKTYKKLFYGKYKYRSYYSICDDEGSMGYYKEDTIDKYFLSIEGYRDIIIDKILN